MNAEHHAIGHLLEDPVREIVIVIPGRKHLALLRHANRSIPQPRRLGEDRFRRGSAAARDAAAPTVKEREPHAHLRTQARQRFL